MSTFLSGCGQNANDQTGKASRVFNMYSVGQSLGWRVKYDDEGRISARINPAGTVIHYSYVPGNGGTSQSVTASSEDGTAITWFFSPSGKVEAMKDSLGYVKYVYDAQDRLIAVKRDGDPSISYTYDNHNRTASVTVGDSYRLHYSYDYLGRILDYETPAGTIHYDYQTGQGVTIRSVHNGLITVVKRSATGQILSIVHGYSADPRSSSYSLIAKYQYGYGAEGRISEIREQTSGNSIVRQFSYDSFGRLVKATGPNGQLYMYQYNQLGNRVRASSSVGPAHCYVYDWAGRLQIVDQRACKYDSAGNLANIIFQDGEHLYQYNSLGQLTESRNGSETERFEYDGLGRLHNLIDGNDKTTRFISDPLSSTWRPLVEINPVGQQTDVVWEGDQPLATVFGGKPLFLLSDHTGSARVVVDATGNVERLNDFDPFGGQINVPTPGHPFEGFDGLPHDTVSNLSLLGSRAYLPEVGAYLQPDFAEVAKQETRGGSLYDFTSNDPINFTDRSDEGRQPSELDFSCGGTFQRMSPVPSIDHYLYPEETRTNLSDVNEQQFEIRSNSIDCLSDVREHLLQQAESNHDELEAIHSQSVDPLDVGAHQQQLADSFRDGYLPIFGNTVAAGYASIGQAISDFVPGIGGTGANVLTRVLSNYFTDKVKNLDSEVGHNLELGNESVNDALDTANNVKSVWTYGRNLNEIVSQHSLGDAIDSAKDAIRDDLSDKATDHFSDYIVDKANGILDPEHPSPVGGVYLGGAADSIASLGDLRGLEVDSNGNYILIGNDRNNIKLPPLSIDEVVTVFRAVYEGYGPSVTIDPACPVGPSSGPQLMDITHDPVTAGTFCGWVLYSCDRAMKTYSTGVDNITGKPILSSVPEFDQTLDSSYFGASSEDNGVWQRYWIVPQEVNQYVGGPSSQLTIFDVPLKVMTQRMRWENGRLIDDHSFASTRGAVAFADWFTKHFDAIANEYYLTPPSSSGIDHPIPIFTELRRIALLTAIAERLRNAGIPIPAWMRNYHIQRVEFESSTPGFWVSRSRYGCSAHIFGGVDLNPNSDTVKTYGNPDQAPAQLRSRVSGQIRLANTFALAASKLLPSVTTPSLTERQVNVNGQTYDLAAIPGAETKALDPAQLNELDMSVRMPDGTELSLIRRYNSFFDPEDIFGKHWTLNLPHCETVEVPISNNGDVERCVTGYDIYTPLGDINSRITNSISDKSSPFVGVAKQQTKFLNASTLNVLLFDGRTWSFNSYGDLVAEEDGARVTIYERDSAGQITTMLGLVGGTIGGRIDLTYSKDGLLRKAVGTQYNNGNQNTKTVTYNYDCGLLSAVDIQDGSEQYAYHNGLVTAISWKPSGLLSQSRVVKLFKYGNRGQLESDRSGNLTSTCQLAAIPNGVISSHISGNNSSSIQYDECMRPVAETESNGNKKTFTYESNGTTRKAELLPNGLVLTITQSADDSVRTISVKGIKPLVAKYDSCGHLKSLCEAGDITPLLSEEWRPGGQLQVAKANSDEVSFEYDDQGVLSKAVIHPEGASTFTDWIQANYDQRGCPCKITDSAGLEVSLAYDSSCQLISAVQNSSGATDGLSISRDADEKITAVDSTWGKTTCSYAPDGCLSEVDSDCDGKQSKVLMSNAGLISEISGFNGQNTSFTYFQAGNLHGRLRSVLLPNGLVIQQDYDFAGRLVNVAEANVRQRHLDYDSKGRVIANMLQQLIRTR